MSSSKTETLVFDLSGKEAVLRIARCVIQPVQCEWEDCFTTLNSWDALAKHLSRHCSRVTAQDGVYQCSYSRCSGRVHNSLATLKLHVELSHLSRVAVPCPVHDCSEAFVRQAQLDSHFELAHREMLANPVSVHVLSPLATPAPPHSLHAPPPFPRPNYGSQSFWTFVRKAPLSFAYSQATSSQGLSRKWSRLNVQDEEGNKHLIAFDDLRPPSPRDISDPQVLDVTVRRVRQAAPRSLLSRPQPPVYPPVKSDKREQSILYPAFVRTVDKLVDDGVLARLREGKT